MMRHTRRGLFGLLVGACAAPYIPASAAKPKAPLGPMPGGRTILQELEYAEMATYTRYSGYQVLSISPSDIFAAAEYDWKPAAVAMSISNG